MSVFHRGRLGRRHTEIAAIFVHAGAGYHSTGNEQSHLQACNDAATAAMAVLRNGGSAVDAVEIAIKVLEDREITNAGYGSNLTIDGLVEGDAVVVDHFGRSGGVGAISQVKNPISAARLVLDLSTQELSLRRVPPNLLVGQGAANFAHDQGMLLLPPDFLVSQTAKDRWTRWKQDLLNAERRDRQQARAGRLSTQRDSEITAKQLLDPPPNYEEHVRREVHREHERAAQASVWNEGQPVSPPSSAGQRAQSGLPSPSRTSSVDSRFTPITPMTPSADVGPSGSALTAENLAQIAAVQSRGGMSTLPRRRATDAQDAARDSMESIEEEGSESYIDTCYELVKDDGQLVMTRWKQLRYTANVWQDGEIDPNKDATSSSGTLQLPSSSEASPLLSHEKLDKDDEDDVTDTVGAIAIDNEGNIACGASSGGIGMKFAGRIGPAALVGIGAAVVPTDAEDMKRTCTAAVVSGTGEHMATTLAANVCAERLYHNQKKRRGGGFEHCEDDHAIRSMIENDFMDHPSVKNSNSAGAIGVLAVKKTANGAYLYFAHNTDSFALASMHADEPKPTCTMSRSHGNGMIAAGGRAIRPQPPTSDFDLLY